MDFCLGVSKKYLLLIRQFSVLMAWFQHPNVCLGLSCIFSPTICDCLCLSLLVISSVAQLPIRLIGSIFIRSSLSAFDKHYLHLINFISVWPTISPFITTLSLFDRLSFHWIRSIFVLTALSPFDQFCHRLIIYISIWSVYLRLIISTSFYQPYLRLISLISILSALSPFD